MRLFSALGLIIMLIALKFLMPPVFVGIENTLTQFFELTQTILEDPSSMTASVFQQAPEVPHVSIQQR